MDRLRATLFRPVDIASLVFFRVAFGLTMLWEVKRYFDYGWISRYWIDPEYNFTYTFFDWVHPWPGNGMYVHFYVMGALGACIMVGFLYRVSTVLFFLAFTYAFLLEQARYLNHFYLVILVSFLMIFVPAHRAYSVDAWIWPRMRRRTIPAWPVILVAGQMGVVYFFGGVAKINADWLRGEPLRDWIADRTAFPIIGPWFVEEWVVYVFAYSALLLDLLAVPLLLSKYTRPAFFAFVVFFHYMNDRLFSIGIFPWFAIVTTTLFFPPDWPRRLVEGLRARRDLRTGLAWTSALVLAALTARYRRAVELVPVLVGATAGALLGWTFFWPGGRAVRTDQSTAEHGAAKDRTDPDAVPVAANRRLVVALICAWFALQSAIPLRHFLIPGNVSWTEEGHNFAWHMKLRDKSGLVRFRIVDPSDDSNWSVDPRDYLTRWQYRTMSTRPEMIRQFARYLASESAAEGNADVEVYVRTEASLNGRDWQTLIDPDVDLAGARFRWGQAPWILPLTEPLVSGE